MNLRCDICGRNFRNELGLRLHDLYKHRINTKASLNNFMEEAKSEESPSKGGSSQVKENGIGYIPQNIVYDDWCEYLPILQKAYEKKLFTLIIGPKGTGKTSLVRKFAEMMGKPLYSINFSLRTKESHLIGSTILQNGSTEFHLGIIPLSMVSGGILYLDELNAAEPDVLIRLDEALDDRKELILKEAGEVKIIRAHPDWFVVATVNPLTHAGTKELPPQLLSRFPVRLYLDYPPADVEKKIAKMYVKSDDWGEDLDKAVKLANKLREAAKVEDIYYAPSIRETIAFLKLCDSGTPPKMAAELIFANTYAQWGDQEVKKVKDLIVSLWGESQK
jgi:nitric oxide reductase NorQ protein